MTSFYQMKSAVLHMFHAWWIFYKMKGGIESSFVTCCYGKSYIQISSNICTIVISKTNRPSNGELTTFEGGCERPLDCQLEYGDAGWCGLVNFNNSKVRGCD